MQFLLSENVEMSGFTNVYGSITQRSVTTHYLIEDFVDALAAHVPDRYRHAMRRFGLLAPRTTSAALFLLLGQSSAPVQNG